MLSSRYIEDAFIQFYNLAMIDEWPMQIQDMTAAGSFYSVIVQGKELTQNQANFILKLMAKYQAVALRSSLDYQELLKTPEWKHPFRVLDLSKKIFVEKDSDGTVWACAKFPYQLKKEFDTEFEEQKSPVNKAIWDSERKLRKIYIYEANLVQLYEFAQRHNFEIDDTFMIALADVEEIWQNQDDILPSSELTADWVTLFNSSEETQAWWNQHQTNQYESNLLLAKSMGYPYRGKPHTLVEKIAASPSNSFWIKTNSNLFQLYKSINGKVAVVLDRTANTLEWLQSFIDDADNAGILRSDIRVCFREHKDQNTGLNDWIKTNDVGGKVEDGKILIFEFKPAKWLFKEQECVTMLVSNNLYPSTNQITKDWFNTHPLVVYLGDIKPSEQKGQTIVEL
jgi:hypothetical protein